MKLVKTAIKVGDYVTIKAPGSWLNGEWGVVRAIDKDGTYYVAPYGEDDTQLVFDKSELRKMEYHQ